VFSACIFSQAKPHPRQIRITNVQQSHTPPQSVCISSFHPSWVSSTPRSHDHPTQNPQKRECRRIQGIPMSNRKSKRRLVEENATKKPRTLSYRRTPHCCLNSPLLCSCRTSKLDMSSASRTRSKVRSQYLPTIIKSMVYHSSH
jgi:hypothetical protein